MKINDITIKTKFNIGDKVYYKRTNKCYETKIIGVRVQVVKIKGKSTIKIEYKAYGFTYYWSNRKSIRWFNETKLFSTKEALAKGVLPTQEKKIVSKIKTIKQKITRHKKNMKEANKKLNEIRQEELIEELAGL